MVEETTRVGEHSGGSEEEVIASIDRQKLLCDVRPRNLVTLDVVRDRSDIIEIQIVDPTKEAVGANVRRLSYVFGKDVWKELRHRKCGLCGNRRRIFNVDSPSDTVNRRACVEEITSWRITVGDELDPSNHLSRRQHLATAQLESTEIRSKPDCDIARID